MKVIEQTYAFIIKYLYYFFIGVIFILIFLLLEKVEVNHKKAFFIYKQINITIQIKCI